MSNTECEDCKLRNGNCGHHFKMNGKTNYDIPSLSACDRYGNCEFFQQKEKPQGKWISVSERLPEEDGVYLVTLEYVEDSEIIYETDMAKFVYSEKDDCNNGFHKAYTVIAWQPSPEPYQKGEKK